VQPGGGGHRAAGGDWRWSSYRSHVGLAGTRDWLDSDGLHSYLLGRPVADARDQRLACWHYAALVNEPHAGDTLSWQQALRGQAFLGDEACAARVQALAEPRRIAGVETPSAQHHRRAAHVAGLP